MDAKNTILLVLILLLALFLRSKDIESNPPELFSDEIVNFVSARSVIERGHDLKGNLMPYFSDIIEPRPPVYGYFSYLFTRVFGEGAAGVRSAASSVFPRARPSITCRTSTRKSVHPPEPGLPSSR